MKPEQSEQNIADAEESASLTGDVIGDTAYSERFVLKILLKLANLDTLKHEIQEKSFEDDLCTLWDMTAERDVVLFLQKHDVLKLFNFALPVLESPRLIEIIVGIIGNMCCQKEAVIDLLNMDSFIAYLLEYVKSDDSLILIQLLRLVSSSLFLANSEDVNTWMNLFTSTGYATALYFILKNSSNKDLLVTALENLNTVYSCCNIDNQRVSFFTQFVTVDALESLSAAFQEVVNKKDLCEIDELERIQVISLQIILTLVGFDKSPEIYSGNQEDVIGILNKVLTYYRKKLVNHKNIDTDLVDIIDSSNTIISILRIGDSCGPDKYFEHSYSMWKALKTLKSQTDSGNTSLQDKKKDIEEFIKQINIPLATLICMYMENCSGDYFLKVLDEIGKDYEDIVSVLNDEKLQTAITKRASNYRTRLKENVDS